MSRITVCNRTGDTSSVGTAYHYGVYCGSHNHAHFWRWKILLNSSSQDMHSVCVSYTPQCMLLDPWSPVIQY